MAAELVPLTDLLLAAVDAHRTELERDLADVNAGEVVIRWNRLTRTVKLESRVSRTYTLDTLSSSV